jgi:PleD family two-component response regulator
LVSASKRNGSRISDASTHDASDRAGPSVVVVVRRDADASGIRSSPVVLGYVIATVGSAAEALDAVETYCPDLVLMDVHLEKGDDGIACWKRSAETSLLRKGANSQPRSSFICLQFH